LNARVYYLKTCSTCKRILKEVRELKDFELIDVKTHQITEGEIDEIAQLANGYEAIFNKRAKKYIETGLNKENLSEADFKKLLLQEYTYLKRPVFIIDRIAFVGNSKKTIENLKNYLKSH